MAQKLATKALFPKIRPFVKTSSPSAQKEPFCTLGHYDFKEVMRKISDRISDILLLPQGIGLQV